MPTQVKTLYYIGPKTEEWFDDKANALLEQGWSLHSVSLTAGLTRDMSLVPALLGVFTKNIVRDLPPNAPQEPRKRGRPRKHPLPDPEDL